MSILFLDKLPKIDKKWDCDFSFPKETEWKLETESSLFNLKGKISKDKEFYNFHINQVYVYGLNEFYRCGEKQWLVTYKCSTVCIFLTVKNSVIDVKHFNLYKLYHSPHHLIMINSKIEFFDLKTNESISFKLDKNYFFYNDSEFSYVYVYIKKLPRNILPNTENYTKIPQGLYTVNFRNTVKINTSDDLDLFESQLIYDQATESHDIYLDLNYKDFNYKIKTLLYLLSNKTFDKYKRKLLHKCLFCC